MPDGRTPWKENIVTAAGRESLGADQRLRRRNCKAEFIPQELALNYWREGTFQTCRIGQEELQQNGIEQAGTAHLTSAVAFARDLSAVERDACRSGIKD